MRTHWALEVLELPHDADERAIKRAYATKLKTTRPESDPAGFQHLHEAYRHALQWAAARQHQQWDADEEDDDSEADIETVFDPNAASAAVAFDTEIAAMSDEEREAFFDSLDEQPPDMATPSLLAAADLPSESEQIELDLDTLFDDCLRAAFDKDPKRIRRWLQQQPALWSLQHKAMIGFWLLRLLDDRRPPIPGYNFDTIVEFFGYHDLRSGYDPLALRQLRERLNTIWGEEHKSFTTLGVAMAVQPGAPVPWSIEAGLARVRMEQERLERKAPLEDAHEEQHRARTIRRIAARDHRQLIDPPNRLRDLWLASLPGYAASVRAFLLEATHEGSQAMPPGFRDAEVRFWLAAGDDRHWTSPRAHLAFARCVTWALALALIAWGGALLAGVGYAQNFNVLVAFGIAVGVFVALWLVAAAFKSILYWQSASAPDNGFSRWTHRALVPLLLAMSMVLSAQDEITLSPFYFGMIATLVALTRLRGRRALAAGAEPGLPPLIYKPVFYACVGLFSVALPLLIQVDDVALTILLTLWGVSLALWLQTLSHTKRPAKQDTLR